MVPLLRGTGVDQGFHHRRLITWGCSRDRHKLAGGVVSRLPIKWQLRMQGVLIASALIALVSVGQFLYIRWSVDPREIPPGEVDRFVARLPSYDKTQVLTVSCFPR